MTGLERMIQKVSNMTDRHMHREPEPGMVPVNVEIEALYLSRLDAISAAEKAFACEQRSQRRAYHFDCE